jgi:hypothetical protein
MELVRILRNNIHSEGHMPIGYKAQGKGTMLIQLPTADTDRFSNVAAILGSDDWGVESLPIDNHIYLHPDIL